MVAAATFRATLAGDTPSADPRRDRVLAGFRRDAAPSAGRGQAAPLLTADGLAAILATADRRRETGRGRESARIAARRAALDKALAAVLFQGALRRGEAAALEWRDVAPATTAGAILLTVRRSKTDQEGTAADVRYLKDAAAAAVLALRPAAVDPTARVFGGLTPQQLGRRFTAAGQAAGLPVRLTAHSGRVGLALRAHRPRRLDRRRHAGRRVEDRPHGRPLLGRRRRRTRRRRPFPLNARVIGAKK